MSEMGEGDSDGEFFSRRPSNRHRRQYSPKRDKVQYNYNFELSSDEETDDRKKSKGSRRRNCPPAVSPPRVAEPPPFLKRVLYNQAHTPPIQPVNMMQQQAGPPMMIPMPMNMAIGMPNQVGPLPMGMGMPMANQMGHGMPMGPICIPPMGLPPNMVFPNQMNHMLGSPPVNMTALNRMPMPNPVQMASHPQQCMPRGHYFQPNTPFHQKPFGQLPVEEPSPNAIISKPPMLKNERVKVPLISPSSPEVSSKTANDSDSEASSVDTMETVGFKNDGSFLELFKKMKESETTDDKSEVKKSIQKKLTSGIVRKRRGGRVLKTGVVEKIKKTDSADSSTPQDPWSIYMAEVKKYRETNCEEEGKIRALVK